MSSDLYIRIGDEDYLRGCGLNVSEPFTAVNEDGADLLIELDVHAGMNVEDGVMYRFVFPASAAGELAARLLEVT